VHDAPTAFGTISYAVRWHGDRVALLWEVQPHPGQGPVRLISPGLDPTWSTTDLRGEALLGPVPVPPPSSLPPTGDGTVIPETAGRPGTPGTVGTPAPGATGSTSGTVGAADASPTGTAVSIGRSGSVRRPPPEGGSFA
jgi:hypothetical protein